MGKTVSRQSSGVLHITDDPLSPGPGEHDFDLYFGSLFTDDWRFRLADGSNRALQNYELRMQLRASRKSDSTLLLELTTMNGGLRHCRVDGAMEPEDYDEDEDDLPEGHVLPAIKALSSAALDFRRAAWDLEAVPLVMTDATAIALGANTVTLGEDGAVGTLTASGGTPFSSVQKGDVITLSGCNNEMNDGDYTVYDATDTVISTFRHFYTTTGESGISPTITYRRYVELSPADYTTITITEAADRAVLTASGGTPFTETVTIDDEVVPKFAAGDYLRICKYDATDWWDTEGDHDGFYQAYSVTDTVLTLTKVTPGGPDADLDDLLITRVDEDAALRLLGGIVTASREATREEF